MYKRSQLTVRAPTGSNSANKENEGVENKATSSKNTKPENSSRDSPNYVYRKIQENVNREQDMRLKLLEEQFRAQFGTVLNNSNKAHEQEIQVLKNENAELRRKLEEQQQLVGHQNPRQLIRYYDILKAEISLLRKEVEKLRRSNLNYVISSGKSRRNEAITPSGISPRLATRLFNTPNAQ